MLYEQLEAVLVVSASDSIDSLLLWPSLLTRQCIVAEVQVLNLFAVLVDRLHKISKLSAVYVDALQIELLDLRYV